MIWSFLALGMWWRLVAYTITMASEVGVLSIRGMPLFCGWMGLGTGF